MPQHEYAGLYEGAESFQHLQELQLDDMRFSHGIVMPRGLQWVMFWDVYFLGAVRLDVCRCATMALQRFVVAGQFLYKFGPCQAQ